MKTALVLGGAGFIGHHMARRLKAEGYHVTVIDIKQYEYGEVDFCHQFCEGDLRQYGLIFDFVKSTAYDEIYTFACQMGGAGYVFTGENDSDIMHDSALINLNLLNALKETNFKGKVFYSSSACMYPKEVQESEYTRFGHEYYGDATETKFALKEVYAYPANPDSEYGWEKLFSERLFMAFGRNHGIDYRIARFHNIYGEEGTYTGGREKAPAAMCRKAILGTESVEVWGDGKQQRSFLYIEDCIDAVRLLMKSDFKEPINIGSEQMVTINKLAEIAINLSNKELEVVHVKSNALGVRGRNSENTLIKSVLGWEPKYNLHQGMRKTFNWIKSQYES